MVGSPWSFSLSDLLMLSLLRFISHRSGFPALGLVPMEVSAYWFMLWFGRLQGPQAVINQMVSETPGKADALCASWRVDVCVYLKPSFSTCAFPREDGLVLVHTWRVLQLMKINLRIRWSNLTPLGSGAQGEKYITNGQFSIWSSRVKKVCKKKKKKTCTDQASKIPLQFEEGAKWDGDWGGSVISSTEVGSGSVLLHFNFQWVWRFGQTSEFWTDK